MPRMSRRELLAASGAVLALSAAGSNAANTPVDEAYRANPSRLDRRYALELARARAHYDRGTPTHRTNGDERLDPPGIAAYTKGLRHDADGFVNAADYRRLDAAIAANDFRAIEALDVGGHRRFVCPLGSWALPIVGIDSSQVVLDPLPSVMTKAFAAELCELYWMSLVRDVPFARWDGDPMIASAVRELAKFDCSWTVELRPSTVFRGRKPGDLAGPYVSQFMWQRVKGGVLPIDQRVRAYLAGFDFLTTPDDWLASQNGQLPQQPSPATPRFVRSLRDLASYVHRDYAVQLPLYAALILLGRGDDNDGVGITVPYASGNPYRDARVQEPFVNLGSPQVSELLGLAANAALRAVWYHKWLVHRSVRPEEAAGRIHLAKTAKRDVPIHRDAIDCDAVGRVYDRHRSYLLPQAYPDGCPLHPSFPSGHAAIGGACITVLKALFDEERVLDQPVIPTEDGLGLVPWRGEDLTIGGELDKLATNLAYGRNAAGIHYRTDGDAGLLLGEQIAIEILRDLKPTLPEPDVVFRFRTFSGARIHI
jgi:membrane-associated phospholipid phosphatase